MRVEFNWTANEKRAKCVELFESIVDRVAVAYGLSPADRQMADCIVRKSVGYARWLRAEFHRAASDAAMAEIYDADLRELYKAQLATSLHSLVDKVTIGKYVSAFGYCMATVTAIGIDGIAEGSQTYLTFRTFPSENYEFEIDREARDYYPEETGSRLDKLLSNLVVLHCAMENYQTRNLES